MISVPELVNDSMRSGAAQKLISWLLPPNSQSINRVCLFSYYSYVDRVPRDPRSIGTAGDLFFKFSVKLHLL